MMRTFVHEQEQGSAEPARTIQETARTRPDPHPILHLQRTLGNRAVQRLLQRNAEPCACGGECPKCRAEQEREVAPEISRRASHEHDVVSRQVPSTVPGVSPPAPAPPTTPPVKQPPEALSPGCPSGAWPPDGWLTATPGKHAQLDTGLVKKMQDSYKEHNKDKHSLAEGFAGTDPQCPAYWPKTFWDAVDKIPKANLDVIQQVSKRAMLYSDLWSKIERIRFSWSTSSQGYKFHTSSEADISTFLAKSPSFCKDNALTEGIYHGRQMCWREVGRVNQPGLHVCLGAGQPPDIHLDPHQIAEGKEADGSCNIDVLSWVSHAVDQ